MSRLPREARDGLMRVWLQLLAEKHPGVAWVPAHEGPEEQPVVGGGTPAAEFVDEAGIGLASAA